MTDFKQPSPVDSPTSFDNGAPMQSTDHDRIDPESGVKRALKTRHLSMLALAGIIGPGLLVGSGGALSNGGPASLIIGFGVIGIIAFSIMQSLGELTTLYPSGGAFTELADRFVDKAFGVAVGYNYFIIWAAVLANEYNVITSVLVYWSDAVPQWGYFLIFWFAFFGFQMLGVESFGEAEFWLALLKIAGLCAYFIFSIVYVAGGVNGDAVGDRYWHDPGAFNGNGFRGVASVFVFCSTFYAGVESVAVAATETKNPLVAVPLAIRQVFWRIIFIYMGSAIFFGLTCPANADGLINGSSRALRSPMTVAIQNAGWHGGVHLINSFIFITCLSAVNSSIYIGSRTILFMAQTGKAPRFLGYTDPRGVPVFAILLTNLFGALSMMNVSTGASKAVGSLCFQPPIPLLTNLIVVLLHSQPLRRQHLPRLGLHQPHPHPLPTRLVRPRPLHRRPALQIAPVPLERLLRPLRQRLSGRRARLDDPVTIQRRELCRCVYPASAVSGDLRGLQGRLQDEAVACTRGGSRCWEAEGR